MGIPVFGQKMFIMFTNVHLTQEILLGSSVEVNVIVEVC